MTDYGTTIYRCADGSEFPVAWQWPDAEKQPWAANDSHLPHAEPPLSVELHDLGHAGSQRAFKDVGITPVAIFNGWQWANGYQYYNATLPTEQEFMAMQPAIAALRERYGGTIGTWENYFRPSTIDSVRALNEAGDEVALATLADIAEYGFFQTLVSVTTLLGTVVLTQMIAPVYGAEAELKVFEMVQGGANATQDVDQEIWALARVARSSAPVRSLFGRLEGEALLEALRAEPAAAGFVTEFEALVAKHQIRSQGWGLWDRTWGEDPKAPLELVRNHVVNETPSPAEATIASDARRAAAVAEVLAAMPPEVGPMIKAFLGDLDGYVNIREGRAYWQMVNRGAFRHAVLRQGDRLVREGRLSNREDVFFLSVAEVESKASGSLDGQAAARRKEWENWSAKKPPEFIGAPLTGPAILTTPVMQAAHARQIVGAPASRGTITARARVLSSPSEGARLGPGEVLVCRMTTPAWTPLFAIAGAIVTETGAALSHPAITAREYGIPCVVGARGALTGIRDGQVITVDGTTGTIDLGD